MVVMRRLLSIIQTNCTTGRSALLLSRVGNLVNVALEPGQRQLRVDCLHQFRRDWLLGTDVPDVVEREVCSGAVEVEVVARPTEIRLGPPVVAREQAGGPVRVGVTGRKLDFPNLPAVVRVLAPDAECGGGH